MAACQSFNSKQFTKPRKNVQLCSSVSHRSASVGLHGSRPSLHLQRAPPDDRHGPHGERLQTTATDLQTSTSRRPPRTSWRAPPSPLLKQDTIYFNTGDFFSSLTQMSIAYLLPFCAFLRSIISYKLPNPATHLIFIRTLVLVAENAWLTSQSQPMTELQFYSEPFDHSKEEFIGCAAPRLTRLFL